MTRPRVAETEQGIQGEFTVNLYDQMQRRLRDKGWNEAGKLYSVRKSHRTQTHWL